MAHPTSSQDMQPNLAQTQQSDSGNRGSGDNESTQASITPYGWLTFHNGLLKLVSSAFGEPRVIARQLIRRGFYICTEQAFKVYSAVAGAEGVTVSHAAFGFLAYFGTSTQPDVRVEMSPQPPPTKADDNNSSFESETKGPKVPTSDVNALGDIEAGEDVTIADDSEWCEPSAGGDEAAMATRGEELRDLLWRRVAELEAEDAAGAAARELPSFRQAVDENMFGLGDEGLISRSPKRVRRLAPVYRTYGAWI
jgi:hypothetical protein